MLVAIVRLLELMRVQLTPSMDAKPCSMEPERTTRAQAFGGVSVPAVVTEVPPPVDFRRCHRTVPAGEIPRNAYLELLMRLSRIIAPMRPPLPMCCTELIC